MSETTLLPEQDRGAPEAAGVAVTAAAPSADPSAPAAMYDVQHLIRPAKDYLGAAVSGAPQDMSRIDAYAKRIGAKPNLITIYESFDDRFAAAEVRKIYQYGALPIVRWEPFKQGLGDIAVISQPAPTPCIAPPMSEATLASQSARNVGYESGAHGDAAIVAGRALIAPAR